MGAPAAAAAPARPEQVAAAARLQEAEANAELTRLRRDLAGCRAQEQSVNDLNLASATPLTAPAAAPGMSLFAPLSLVAGLGFGAGFLGGVWWLDWRQRRRHGGFRL